MMKDVNENYSGYVNCKCNYALFLLVYNKENMGMEIANIFFAFLTILNFFFFFFLHF